MSQRGGAVPVVPNGASFEGTLAYRGEVRIDGRLNGQVIATGALEIGEHGEVRARVEVDELVVAGHLQGDAVANRRIELRSSARVEGDLRAPTVVLADGCLLQGRLQAGEAGAQPRRGGAAPLAGGGGERRPGRRAEPGAG
jgi:cytoskeletal protein CcmA (bactofilin family)